MACSFEDVALLHMVHQLRPNSEIIFLDTRGHFPETLEFASRIERDWSLNMTRTTPVPTPTRGLRHRTMLRTSQVEPLGGRHGQISLDHVGETSRRAVAYEHENPDVG